MRVHTHIYYNFIFSLLLFFPPNLNYLFFFYFFTSHAYHLTSNNVSKKKKVTSNNMSFYKFQGTIIISQRVILRPQLLTQLAHVTSLEWWVHNFTIHDLSRKQIVTKVVVLAFSLHKLFYKKLSLWSFTFTCLLTYLISSTFQILLSFRPLPLLHFFRSLSLTASPNFSFSLFLHFVYQN